VADIPCIVARPPLRCFFLDGDRLGQVCARDAVFVRPSSAGVAPQFFCAEHSRDGDEPVTDDVVFRLVSITLEVRLCGINHVPGFAHSEALSRLELAIAAAGGVINLHACRSQLARLEPQAPIGAQPAGRPRRL